MIRGTSITGVPSKTLSTFIGTGASTCIAMCWRQLRGPDMSYYAGSGNNTLQLTSVAGNPVFCFQTIFLQLQLPINSKCI
jgi:hypothetical protein